MYDNAGNGMEDFHSDLSNQMHLTQFLKNIGLAAGFYFLDKSEQHNYFRN